MENLVIRKHCTPFFHGHDQIPIQSDRFPHNLHMDEIEDISILHFSLFFYIFGYFYLQFQDVTSFPTPYTMTEQFLSYILYNISVIHRNYFCFFQIPVPIFLFYIYSMFSYNSFLIFIYVRKLYETQIKFFLSPSGETEEISMLTAAHLVHHSSRPFNVGTLLATVAISLRLLGGFFCSLKRWWFNNRKLAHNLISNVLINIHHRIVYYVEEISCEAPE